MGHTDARLRHVTHPSPAGGLEEGDASAREEGRQSGRRRRDGCADAATRSGLRRDGLGATLLRKEALRLGCYAVAKRGPKFSLLTREGIIPGSLRGATGADRVEKCRAVPHEDSTTALPWRPFVKTGWGGSSGPLEDSPMLRPGAETPSRRTRRIRWILDGTDVISERGRTRRKTPEEHHVWPRLEAMKRHMARGETPCGGMTHFRPTMRLTPPLSGAGAGY